jgi:hypothetical protein
MCVCVTHHLQQEHQYIYIYINTLCLSTRVRERTKHSNLPPPPPHPPPPLHTRTSHTHTHTHLLLQLGKPNTTHTHACLFLQASLAVFLALLPAGKQRKLIELPPHQVRGRDQLVEVACHTHPQVLMELQFPFFLPLACRIARVLAYACRIALLCRMSPAAAVMPPPPPCHATRTTLRRTRGDGWARTALQLPHACCSASARVRLRGCALRA